MESAAPWMLQSVLESSSEMLSAPICGFLYHLDEEGFMVGKKGMEHPSEPQEQHGQETNRLLLRLLIIFPTKKVQYIVYSGAV